MDNFYRYRAIVTNVYDGDTITVNIDLGFSIWMFDQKLRLFGIDTPELRGEEREEGLVVRDYVREKIPVGSDIIIETVKDKTGKYGRYLATVFYYNALYDGSINLNEELLKNKMAKVYGD